MQPKTIQVRGYSDDLLQVWQGDDFLAEWDVVPGSSAPVTLEVSDGTSLRVTFGVRGHGWSITRQREGTADYQHSTDDARDDTVTLTGGIRWVRLVVNSERGAQVVDQVFVH